MAAIMAVIRVAVMAKESRRVRERFRIISKTE